MQIHRVLVIHPPEPQSTTQVIGTRLVLCDSVECAMAIVKGREPDGCTIAYDHAYGPGEVIKHAHMTMPRSEAAQWAREAPLVA
jgi:hypothetical protein